MIDSTHTAGDGLDLSTWLVSYKRTARERRRARERAEQAAAERRRR